MASIIAAIVAALSVLKDLQILATSTGSHSERAASRTIEKNAERPGEAVDLVQCDQFFGQINSGKIRFRARRVGQAIAG